MAESLSHFAIKNLSRKEDFFTLIGGVEAKANEEGQLSVNVPWISTSWIKTDDKVELKTKDRFQWLGRFSDIINSGGVKINPYVCESKLIEPLRAFFDKDRSFYITSLPDASLGQKVQGLELPTLHNLHHRVNQRVYYNYHQEMIHK